MSVVRISNQMSTAVPVNGVSGRTVTAATAAASLIVAPLNEQTQGIYWSITGANARVTFDGTTPTSTLGHQLVNGDEGIWSPTLANAAKIIREASTDAPIYITEINYL